jgi:hypothetical protein
MCNVRELQRHCSVPKTLVFWLSGAPDTGANIYSGLYVYQYFGHFFE